MPDDECILFCTSRLIIWISTVQVIVSIQQRAVGRTWKPAKQQQQQQQQRRVVATGYSIIYNVFKKSPVHVKTDENGIFYIAAAEASLNTGSKCLVGHG